MTEFFLRMTYSDSESGGSCAGIRKQTTEQKLTDGGLDMERFRFIRSAAIILAGLFCAVTESAALAPPEILVLSNRADLISGGDALVEIRFPAGGVNPAFAKVALNGQLINSSFAMRANGRYMGLVTGLKNGSNLL